MAKKQETKGPKYDAELVIKLWEGGMRPSEIRQSDKPGVKGISSAFVSRILFGTTYCANWAYRLRTRASTLFDMALRLRLPISLYR